MKRFTGKTALITGAARGIGRGVALCLAQEGANIVINDIDPGQEAVSLGEAVAELGGQSLIWQTDVSDREQVKELFTTAAARFGRLDVVVANAAYSVRRPVVEAEWKGILRTLQVSQFGVFHTVQMAAQHMVKQPLTGRSRGKIVIIGSVHEEVAAPESAGYNMAKAAINHLARTMAVELAGHKINVNVINPGWIDTPGERKFYSEEEIYEGAKAIPWGRIGIPEDIGKAAAFLASDEADYITGAALRIDGGYVVGRTTSD